MKYKETKTIPQTAPRQLNTHHRSSYSLGEAASRPLQTERACQQGENAADDLGQEGVRCVAKIKKKKKGTNMKVSQFKDYSEIPLFLNAELVAKVLGVSPSSSYELMHEPGLPGSEKSETGWSYPRRSSSGGWSRTLAEGQSHEAAHHADQLATP